MRPRHPPRAGDDVRRGRRLSAAQSSRFSAEVAPSHRALAVAAALVAANLTLFVLIAEDVLDGGGLISHDEAVLSWFVDHRTDRSIRLAKLVSTLGAYVSLAIVSALIGFWLWRRGTHVLLAAAPLASLSLASLASTVAKSIFERDRPPIAVHATTRHARLVSIWARDQQCSVRPRGRAHACAHGCSPSIVQGAAGRGGSALRRARRNQSTRARRPLALGRRRRLGARQLGRHRRRGRGLVPRDAHARSGGGRARGVTLRDAPDVAERRGRGLPCDGRRGVTECPLR